MFHSHLLYDRTNYLQTVLVESCSTHTLVISLLTHDIFSPVRPVQITAPYSMFCLYTCIVYLVNLSHHSTAIPEVRYLFTICLLTACSCLDSLIRLSR